MNNQKKLRYSIIMSILGKFLKRTIQFCIQTMHPRLRLLIDVAFGSLSDTYLNWFLHGFLVEGKIRGTDINGSLIYFSKLPQYSSWIENFLISPTTPESIGRFSLLSIAKRNGILSECDALIYPSNPFSQRILNLNKWHVIPKYIECCINLHIPIEQLIQRHGAKDDLRIAKKKNYRFELLRSDLAFDEFYQEMLVPTSRIRHEDRANISSIETLRSQFHHGYLLAAYQGNEWVGANLMIPQPDKTLNWANVGWRGGSDQLMKDRLVSALMHEMIVRGKEEGYDTLNLGSCNPFVNDGPLSYKLKWGANMALPQIQYVNNQLQGLRSFLSVYINIKLEGGRQMLQNSPLLEKHDHQLRAIGWNSPLRSDFKNQIKNGIPWINLAESDNVNENSYTNQKDY